MPIILGVEIHIWSSIIIIAVATWGYYITTTVRKYSLGVKYVTIIVSAIIVLGLYWYISPLVGIELRQMELSYGDSTTINLTLLLMGASVVMVTRYYMVDKIRKQRTR